MFPVGAGEMQSRRKKIRCIISEQVIEGQVSYASHISNLYRYLLLLLQKIDLKMLLIKSQISISCSSTAYLKFMCALIKEINKNKG